MKSGLPRGQLSANILRALSESGPQTVISVAKALRLDTTIVGNSLAQLGRKGRIRRVGWDKNAVIWEIASEGDGGDPNSPSTPIASENE